MAAIAGPRVMPLHLLTVLGGLNAIRMVTRPGVCTFYEAPHLVLVAP